MRVVPIAATATDIELISGELIGDG